MNTKDVLAKFKNAPIDRSIGLVAMALGASPVLVAVKDATPDDLQLHVAADKQGLLWTYVFTDQDEFSRTFPAGAAFAEMNFADLLDIIGPDERFGGVFINSSSDLKYPIPRQLFAIVYRTIRQPGH